MVTNATRRPGSARTGIGSRASSVARHSVARLRKAKTPITPVVTVITIEATLITVPASLEGQWLGSISQTRNPPSSNSAASTSRVLRIGRESIEPAEADAVAAVHGRPGHRAGGLAPALVVVFGP